MTKLEAIQIHTQLVAKLKALRADPIQGYSKDEQDQAIKDVERQISIHAQAHNPHISAKSRHALQLVD